MLQHLNVASVEIPLRLNVCQPPTLRRISEGIMASGASVSSLKQLRKVEHCTSSWPVPNKMMQEFCFLHGECGLQRSWLLSTRQCDAARELGATLGAPVAVSEAARCGQKRPRLCQIQQHGRAGIAGCCGSLLSLWEAASSLLRHLGETREAALFNTVSWTEPNEGNRRHSFLGGRCVLHRVKWGRVSQGCCEASTRLTVQRGKGMEKRK